MQRNLVSFSLLLATTLLLCHALYARLIPFAAPYWQAGAGAVSTVACDTPSAQPRYIGIAATSDSSISGSFEPAAGVEDYLIVISTSSRPGFVPATGSSYAPGSTVGNGKVVRAGPGNDFTAGGLAAATNYYVYVYAMKTSCPGGPVYRAYNPAAVLARTTGGGGN